MSLRGHPVKALGRRLSGCRLIIVLQHLSSYSTSQHNITPTVIIVRSVENCSSELDVRRIGSRHPHNDYSQRYRSRESSKPKSMSSRRSSEDPSAKRQKVYRACLGCVSSKTRCEDVRLEGCLRCRTKRKDCSLVESGAADLRQTSTDPGPFAAELESRIEATEEGWRMLSRRVDTLERGLYATANAPSGTSTSGLVQAPTPSLTPVPRPIGVSPMFQALNWSQLPLSETIFNLSSEDGFPDPVARGVVTMEQMEMAFHL